MTNSKWEQFAGVVEEVGPPLTSAPGPATDAGEGGPAAPAQSWSPGDRVMGVTRFGAFVCPFHSVPGV